MKKTLILLLGSILLLTACHSNSGGENDTTLFELSDLPSNEDTRYESGKFNMVKPETDRMLIRTADLLFEVEDIGKTAARITGIVKTHKGYLSSDNESRNSYRRSRTMMIRIPNAEFDAALAAISEGVNYFERKNVRARDVTSEFRDNEARLRAKKALEARYLELLIKAKNVTEMLEIERELGSIREDIERVEGQQKYLSDQISMSTIDLEFYEKIEDSRPETGFGHKMGEALENGLDGLGGFFLVILNLWPLWLILGGLAFFIRIIIRKRRKAREE